MAGDESGSPVITPISLPSPNNVVCELLASAVHALRTGCTEQDAVLAFTEFYSDCEVALAIKTLVKWGNIMPTRRANRSDAAGFKEKKLRQVKDIFTVVKDADFQDTLNVAVCYLIQDLDRVCFVPHSLTDTIFMRTEQATVKKKVEALEKSVHEMLHNMHQMVGDVAEAANRVTTTAGNAISEIKKNGMSGTAAALSLNIPSCSSIADPMKPWTPGHSRNIIESLSKHNMNRVSTPLTRTWSEVQITESADTHTKHTLV
ncbi:unnamed protein product [Orchesella dallaii]|uniref:Uncharacterized protein n=1 Tax=Orchesella dallaii TaxID=48710 RepID=A0ABP1R1H5_9HEXA